MGYRSVGCQPCSLQALCCRDGGSGLVQNANAEKSRSSELFTAQAITDSLIRDRTVASSSARNSISSSTAGVPDSPRSRLEHVLDVIDQLCKALEAEKELAQ